MLRRVAYIFTCETNTALTCHICATFENGERDATLGCSSWSTLSLMLLVIEAICSCIGTNGDAIEVSTRVRDGVTGILQNDLKGAHGGNPLLTDILHLIVQ